MTVQEELSQVVGQDLEVPLLDGSRRRYINLDNAASTPALLAVWSGVEKFSQWYSSIARGAGFKSQVSTWAYEQSRSILCSFVGAEPAERVVIFGKHTTDAINKLSYRFPFQPGDVLLTTNMEHHANDLPWRDKVEVVRVKASDMQPLDLAPFEDALKKYQGRCKLVAVTGASNVTGIINPIHQLARLAHQYGAQIFVDAAQLAPHRQIRMGSRDDDDCIDYLCISGHKMYAPFGAGALIGWPDIFKRGVPEYVGGGAVMFIHDDEIVWKAPPEREETGSPNVVGAIAMAFAAQALTRIGMQHIAEHEALLTKRLIDGLKAIPDIYFVGPDEYDLKTRVGVISFNLRGMHHSKTAAILGCEFGIGVRNGCFCAQPFLKQLLDCPQEKSLDILHKLKSNQPVDLPGAVRASMGVYNSMSDVEAFLDAMQAIAANRYAGTYKVVTQTGDYWAEGFRPPLSDFFNFELS